VRTIAAVLALSLVGGCAFFQEQVSDLDTPENREKGADVVLKAADVSCDAAVAYLKAVGASLADPAGRIAEAKATCVSAADLPTPAAPVEAPAPVEPPE